VPYTEEQRRKKREYDHRWKLANPEKAEVRRQRNLKQDRERSQREREDPALRAAKNHRQREYHHKKMESGDPAYAAMRKKHERRVIAQRKVDPEKAKRARENALRAYYRVRSDPERWEKYRKRVNVYMKERKRTNPQAKLRSLLGSRLCEVLEKAKVGKTRSTLSLLGCTVAELVAHFECQFKKGMTWKNHGTVWHVDHIIPCCKFDLTDPRQQAMCFNYLNLQPLFAQDNLRKGSRLERPAQMALGL